MDVFIRKNPLFKLETRSVFLLNNDSTWFHPPTFSKLSYLTTVTTQKTSESDPGRAGKYPSPWSTHPTVPDPGVRKSARHGAHDAGVARAFACVRAFFCWSCNPRPLLHHSPSLGFIRRFCSIPHDCDDLPCIRRGLLKPASNRRSHGTWVPTQLPHGRRLFLATGLLYRFSVYLRRSHEGQWITLRQSEGWSKWGKHFCGI